MTGKKTSQTTEQPVFHKVAEKPVSARIIGRYYALSERGGKQFRRSPAARAKPKTGNWPTAGSFNTHNMLQLAARPFERKPGAEDADCFERALYNHLLTFRPLYEVHHQRYSIYWRLRGDAAGASSVIVNNHK